MIAQGSEKVIILTLQVLNAAGRCPPLYATFKNGIAYGFVSGITLDVKTVRDEKIRK